MSHKNIFNFMKKHFRSSHSDNNEKEEESVETIAAQQQKHYSYEILSQATSKFHPSNKLGEGGFGPVYKGKLGDGREIAVKKLGERNYYSRKGTKEFSNEAKKLARVQHKNVVNLFGYSTNGDDKFLVYEYVPNESLDKLLFKSESESDKQEGIDWKKRYEIIMGIAKGLLYLHEGSHCRIIHTDVKATNILLDHKFIPKIADFGMARFFPQDLTHVNTRIAAINGYMAPEYAMHGYLSEKADVFSFGVVTLELISGRRNFPYNNPDDAPCLLEEAYKLFKMGKSLEVVDPTIISLLSPTSVVVEEQLTRCVQIGLLCTQSDPSLRPTMRRVVNLLSKKPSGLDEPTRPGFPGTRYKRRSSKQQYRHGESSVSFSNSNNLSSSSTTTITTTTTTATISLPATTTTTSATTLASNDDPKGKRPVVL